MQGITMEVDNILTDSALSTVISSETGGISDIPIVSLGGLSLFTTPSSLSGGVTSTVLNLPILRDGTVVGTGNTQGLVLATAPDGSGTFLLDASQLTLLAQNAIFDGSAFQVTASEEITSHRNDSDIGENAETLAPRSETRFAIGAQEPEIIQPPIGKGPFRCEVCDREFPKFGQYQRHLKTHIDDKPFKCNKCQASFNVELNLQLHEATHCKKDPLCPACGKKFSRIASLKAHIMFHEKEESLTCAQCGEEFGTQGQLEKHMKRHRDELLDDRIYGCRHCPQRFTRASILRDHMKIHIRIRASLHHRAYKRNIDRTMFPHKCDTCGKMFLKPSQLIRHNRIHTGERPFKCSVCDKAFNQKGALQIHMTKHSGERPHRCDFCPAAFSQRGNLRAHIQRVHIFTKEPNQPLFQCEECHCAFRKLGSLNAHLSRMHSSKENEEVTVTIGGDVRLEKRQNVTDRMRYREVAEDKSNADLLQQVLENSGLTSEDKKSAAEKETQKSAAKEDTVNHKPVAMLMSIAEDASGLFRKHIIRKVGNVRWHQCMYCSKELKKPSDLVRHIRIHTHEKPYKCFQCFRAFAIKSTLTGHLRTHSGVKDFWCSICNKMFATQGSLKVHMRLHTGQRPFACTQCSKQFRTSGHLKNHMLSHAKESNQRKSRRRKSQSITDASLDSIPLQEPILITDAGLVQQLAKNTFILPHMVEENGTLDRPYRCTVCCRGFKKSSHLKQHIRSHTGEKPYKCIQCSRSFVSNGALKAHIKTHSGLKAYRCPVCDSQFTTNGSLKRHMCTHSEVRPYMCPYCQKTFKTAMNCKKHMKTHRHELAVQGGSHVAVTVVPDINSDDAIETAVETVSSSSSELRLVQNMTESERDGEIVIEQSSLIQEPGSQTFVSQDALNQVFGSQPNLAASDLEPTSVAFDQSQLLTQLADGTFTLQNETCTLDLGNGLTTSTANMASILQPVTQKVSSAGEEPNGDVVRQASDDGINAIGSEKTVDENTRPIVKRSFWCQYCNKFFKKSSHLKQHIRSHTGEKPFKCFQCGRTFVSMGILRAHIRTHTGARDFKCRVCAAEFTTNGSLTRHMSTHSSNNPFQCSNCSESFRTKLLYFRHIKIHKENPITSDPAAEANSEGATNDKQQNQQQQQQNKKKASVLQFSDDQAKELAKQKPRENITVSEMVLIASAAEKNRISEIRDKNVELLDSIRYLNQCDHCPKSFRKPSDLVRHIRTHTGEKPYACHICLKSFTVKSTLDCHLKTHSGEKNFACHICNSLFATKGSLKVHMRLHTGAKPFKCPHCHLRFRTSGHRKSHISTHFREGHSRRKKVIENHHNNHNNNNNNNNNNDTRTEQAASPSLIQNDLQTSNIPPLNADSLEENISGSDQASQAQVLQNIEGIQLQLSPGLLGQNIQITGLDPSLLSQTLQIDASLLQHLQQHGNINITIAPNVLTHPLQGSGVTDANFLQNSLNHDSSAASMAVNPNVIIQNFGMHLGENEQFNSGTDTAEGVNENVSILPTFDITVEAANESDEDSVKDVIEESMDIHDESSNNENAMDLEEGIAISGELIHVQNVLNLVPNENFISTEKGYFCAVCSKTFKKVKSLKDHMRTHGVKKNRKPEHQCLQCHKMFSKPSLLERHIRIHTGEKPFACTECDKTFNQKNSLQIHMNKHTQNRPYRCSICSSAFTQKGNLKVHMKKTHDSA